MRSVGPDLMAAGLTVLVQASFLEQLLDVFDLGGYVAFHGVSPKDWISGSRLPCICYTPAHSGMSTPHATFVGG